MANPRHELFTARLHNQRLLGPGLTCAEDVVAWLGAVQSQDYAGAKWALGLRTTGVTDVDVERAFNSGAILRTHVLRPTWHFVTPADIRWILALSGPRVHAVNAHYYRKMELDDRLFSRSRAVVERTLDDGVPRTRSEIGAAFAHAGIDAKGMRLAYLAMHAELDGVICSGPRRGKQFTYALLEHRAPRARKIPRDEALATLVRRYMSSHGPATLRDLAWWSGLTLRDVTAGLEMIRSELQRQDVDGRTYWCVEATPYAGARPRRPLSTPAYLFPNYDEFLIAYKDRELARRHGTTATGPPGPDPFPHHVVLDGCVAGSWRRANTTTRVGIEVSLYGDLSRTRARIAAAAARLGTFLGRPVNVLMR